MSWLGLHIRHFAIPGIRALAKSHTAAPRVRPDITAADIAPFEGRLRPSNRCGTPEAALLYSAISSFIPKGVAARSALLTLCQRFDLKDQLSSRFSNLSMNYAASPENVVHAMVWNSYRALSRRARHPLLLLGRDVWPWFVLAQRRGLPVVFDPRVSRMVAGDPAALRPLITEWPLLDLEQATMFDTGFEGSVHRGLCEASGKRPQLLLLSCAINLRSRQLFPRHAGSRSKALAIEALPKYWQSGHVHAGAARQHLASLESFVRAALLTVWLWHHISPKRIPPRLQPTGTIVGGSASTAVDTGFTLATPAIWTPSQPHPSGYLLTHGSADGGNSMHGAPFFFYHPGGAVTVQYSGSSTSLGADNTLG